MQEDESKYCSCCGDFLVAKGESYYCELCLAIHHGECDELAARYRDRLESHNIAISEALGEIYFLHETNCKIHTAGELDMRPCDCARDRVMRILESLL